MPAMQCAQCHVNNNYSLTSDRLRELPPDRLQRHHQPAAQGCRFPQDCTTVPQHRRNWTSATFNHTTTGFALTGAHTSLQCAQCHVNNNYSLTSAACWNCHQADYNGTNNPPHKSSGFPQDCSGATPPRTGRAPPSTTPTTGFALDRRARDDPVRQCHVNNNFSLTSAACWNCHQTDYNGTTNPPHQPRDSRRIVPSAIPPRTGRAPRSPTLRLRSR